MTWTSIPSWPPSVGRGSGMSCGVGHRCSSDPVLLWLWYKWAAVAPIPPLAWEPPYALGVALKRQKKKKKKKKEYIERKKKMNDCKIYKISDLFGGTCLN